MKRILIALLLPLVSSAQSSLYHRYASRQDLTVAQVSGFHLNDSVTIDVVMVVADNDAVWNHLKQELNIQSHQGVTSWLATPDSPSLRSRWNGSPILRVVASHQRRTVAFYSLDNEQQYDALIFSFR